MSKKIIINKHLLESKEFKELILSSSLSKNIKNEIMRGDTPLSKNPSFPDEDRMPFELKMTLLRYQETKEDLRKIDVIEDVDDVHNLLPALIEKCKRIEEPFRRNLEKLAYNFIVETFNVPEGVINLVVSINDNLSDTTLNVRVQAEDNDFEYDDIRHRQHLHGEINKRRIMNALMSGAALRFASSIKKYVADIYEIDPKLPTLYRDIIALNEYMLFNVDKIEINDKNKNQLGMSNITIGNENIKSEVKVEAVIFPILIYELVKAFLELSSAHGLPKDKHEAAYVMGKCDYLQAEPWYMRIGPALYDILAKMLGDFDDNMLPYLFMELSQLEPEDFQNTMQEILSKTKYGKKILNDILSVYKENEYADDVQLQMQKANTDIDIIADETIKGE